MWEKRGAQKLVHGDTLKGSTRYWNSFEDYWLWAGGLSAVSAIGTRLPDPINSRLTRWWLTVEITFSLNYMDPVAECGGNPVSKTNFYSFWLEIKNKKFRKSCEFRIFGWRTSALPPKAHLMGVWKLKMV